jgi:hypothetical protein
MSGMGCTNLDVLPVPPSGTFGSCYGSWFFTPPGKMNYLDPDVTLRSCDVDLLYGAD